MPAQISAYTPHRIVAKPCLVCRKPKSKSEISNRTKCWRCKDCEREAIQVWRGLNKDRLTTYSREYERLNKQMRSDYSKSQHGRSLNASSMTRYRLRHPEKVAASKIAYRAKRPARIREYTQEYARRYPNYSAQYRHSHPEMWHRVSANRAKMMRETSDGTLTRDVIERLFAESTQCPYCGVEISDRVKKRSDNRKSLDHVVPLSRGGTHSIHNIVICCWKCNRLKGNRILTEIGDIN